MRRLIGSGLALALFLALGVAAQAQSAAVIGTCGSITYDTGAPKAVTQDTTGRHCVQTELESPKATYRVASGFAPAASATEVFSLQGSATKTIRIRRIRFSGIAASTTNINLTITRRSTAATGGTPTVLPATKMDTSDGSASATFTIFTGVPSPLGTLVGNLEFRNTVIPAAGGAPDQVDMTFGDAGDKSVVVRGVSDFVNLNLGTNTLTSINFMIEWTEE